jgi:hypothetical protein
VVESNNVRPSSSWMFGIVDLGLRRFIRTRSHPCSAKVLHVILEKNGAHIAKVETRRTAIAHRIPSYPPSTLHPHTHYRRITACTYPLSCTQHSQTSTCHRDRRALHICAVTPASPRTIASTFTISTAAMSDNATAHDSLVGGEGTAANAPGDQGKLFALHHFYNIYIAASLRRRDEYQQSSLASAMGYLRQLSL